MKALIALLISMSAGGSVAAQDVNSSDVPSIVVNALKTKFPNATDIEWELKDDVYKADFETGKVDHDIWIDASGKITRHQQEIEKKELPATIADQLAASYKDYRVEDIDKIEADGTTQYEIELDGTKIDRKVTVVEDGKVVSDIED